MDAIDGDILRELMADARLPYRELGARVGLSANATAARVRRLVADGTIRGFTVLTGPKGRTATAAIPAGLEVFIDARLEPGITPEHFAAARQQLPEILDAVHLTGGYDYLIHAVVADPAALDLLVRRLKRDAGVAQTLTRLAMRGPIPT